MGFFSPYKKRANSFNYKPRYYDPVKEAREQRRAELHGTSSEDAEHDYVPGQYLKRQRSARSARREERNSDGRMRMWIMMGIAILLMLFMYRLYPVITSAFSERPSKVKVNVEQQAEEEFDPYAPIVIIPND